MLGEEWSSARDSPPAAAWRRDWRRRRGGGRGGRRANRNFIAVFDTPFKFVEAK